MSKIEVKQATSPDTALVVGCWVFLIVLVLTIGGCTVACTYFATFGTEVQVENHD